MRPFGFFSTLATAGATIDAIYQVDFGDDIGGRISPAPWNNYDEGSVGFLAGTSLSNLTDTDSNVSGIEVGITASFDGVNGAGAADDPADPFVFAATRDGFETVSNGTSTIEFRFLDPTKVYQLRLFGSRGFITADSEYEVIGATTEVLLQDNRDNGVGGNPFIVSETGDIAPDGSNVITVNVTGQGSRGYINVIELIEKTP